jgi:hypothetical protein
MPLNDPSHYPILLAFHWLSASNRRFRKQFARPPCSYFTFQKQIAWVFYHPSFATKCIRSEFRFHHRVLLVFHVVMDTGNWNSSVPGCCDGKYQVTRSVASVDSMLHLFDVEFWLYTTLTSLPAALARFGSRKTKCLRHSTVWRALNSLVTFQVFTLAYTF